MTNHNRNLFFVCFPQSRTRMKSKINNDINFNQLLSDAQLTIRTIGFRKPSLPAHYLTWWSALSSSPFDAWPKNNKEARWLIDKHALGEVSLYYEDLDAGYTKALAGLWKVPVPQKWNPTFLFLQRGRGDILRDC